MDQSQTDDIENWISPEMWSDPWRYLTTSERHQDESSTSFLSTPQREMETGTKFAESDFDVTDSVPSKLNAESINPNASSTTSVENSELDTKDQESNLNIDSKMESASRSENIDLLLT
ncbi:hypothetical protein Ocin01_11107 [Orchesella cincta]|uniref:Uncharacterized protein n=1 Tax=Orchesella cincta TaxID=48709 RepID=A0A1D2MRX8_ORCCI|nr:hypothetical protein Ocin01_11107 [Orchesella cincta]